jgi:hypothetical protein
MPFTVEQSNAFKEIFRQSGFLFFKKNNYYFTGNRKASSANTFMKQMGFPEAFEEHEALEPLELKFIKKKFPFDELHELVKEWSKENAPSEVAPGYLELSEELPEGEADEKLVKLKARAKDPHEFLKTLVPVINIQKNAGIKDLVILLDPRNNSRPVTDVNPEVYMHLTGHDLPTLIANESVAKVMTTFDPYNLESVFLKESKSGTVMRHVNFYVPPRWRYVDAPPRYHGFIKLLIDHLFPNENEREYVLDWLHHAIAYRNDTVLCLVGARGTGKAVLLESVLGSLIGREYREIANQETLTEKFNGNFKDKRYVFFDEVNISGDKELNKFKALCNATIAFEAKNKDAYTIDNFTSMALSSNKRDDFRAEPQERRFSAPEVTEKDLSEVVSRDEINDFVTRCQDPESIEIAEFGNWLLEREPVHSSHVPLKGKYFFELCRLSMPEWKSFLIDFMTHQAEPKIAITSAEVGKVFKASYGKGIKFPVRRATVEEFLLQYKHEGIHRLGKVIDAWDSTKGKSTYAIMPNDEFLKKYSKRDPSLPKTPMGDSEEDEDLTYLAQYGMTKAEYQASQVKKPASKRERAL